MKNYKVDIFKILDNISKDNLTFVDSLSEDELKSISPYVLQLWLMGADNNVEARSVLMNEVINPYLFSLGSHKKLLLKLLCVSNGFGINTHFKFNKKKENKLKNTINMLIDYYECNEEEASFYVRMLDKNEITEHAEELGYDSPEIKKIEKELNATTV